MVDDYTDTYRDRAGTGLVAVKTGEGDAPLPFSQISFDEGATPREFDNPDISVTSSGRFATHPIIGGTTVRQKIGEEPLEIQLDGVCTEESAQRINELHRAKAVTLLTDVFEQTKRCQVASTSTDPLQSGGAGDMTSGQLLYSYTINLVEIGFA